MTRIAFVDGEHRLIGVELSVKDVLARLAAGETPASLSAQYPALSPDDVEYCVRYALKNIQ